MDRARDPGVKMDTVLLITGTSHGRGHSPNAVRPGLIETKIHASGGLPNRAHDLAHLVPVRHGGSAAEVAEAMVWLLSDGACYAHHEHA